MADSDSMLDPVLLGRLTRRVTLAPGRREAIEVTAPFTGAPLGTIPRGTPADVREAVRRARAAQPGWARIGFDDRARILLRYHDLVLERREEILDLIQLESGKVRKNAFEEVADVATVSRYYAHHAPRHLRPRRRRGALPGLTAVREYRHPVGVVGCIVPWNYPFNLAVTDALPALMAGNTVVLKPDHQTSFTALWAAELLHEAGLPADVLTVVTGEGPELGPSILEEVDFIMFTGSTGTGRIIARQAAERLIGCSLELGGKNPMVVLEDADLSEAVEGAVRGCFVGAGQVCVSMERLYLHHSVHDRFLERFVERTRELRLSAALDYTGEVGSLASAAQLARVEAHVEGAWEKGATVRTGGKRRRDVGPYFYEPTILTGVTPEMEVYAEETFGPVVSVYAVESDEEAVERANETRYGLNASVWSGSVRRAVRVARGIRAGSVNVNEAYAAAWGSVDAPIGGFRESGMGRRHGAEGILKYTEPQTVAVQRGFPLAAPAGMDEARYAGLLAGTLRLLRRAPGLR